MRGVAIPSAAVPCRQVTVNGAHAPGGASHQQGRVTRGGADARYSGLIGAAGFTPAGTVTGHARSLPCPRRWSPRMVATASGTG